MIDWSWNPRSSYVNDIDYLYWDVVFPGPLRHHRWFYINDCVLSEHVGHQIIEITTELNPIQAQLYRLVYGRLP